MINLLPPEQKNELKREEKRKLVLILGIIFLTFLLCLLLILLSIKISISSELNSQKNLLAIEEARYSTPEIKDFQGKITVVNGKLSEISVFYQEQPDLAAILEKLSANIPPKVYLTNLSWQKDVAQMNISGRAPLRDDLTALKINLEREASFSEVYFPPSNWLKSKDIDFYVTFKAKLQK